MEVIRPTAVFKPSVWGDFFLHYSPSLSMAEANVCD
ncbi:(-)-germacrene D synthase-like [Iris pallida]|uniref:(-)-germacrene D synthase-like n=1 Tax=Iris pallida TaxID=29817 RepID=A0AAX6FBC7_IRIPA|nr:(-)-germacrene D synthase-like [Iris pallida]